MSEYLPFIVAGLVTGAVYGLSGIGLVLTYKTSGVFNFAHGALATVAAYTFYELHVKHGVSWPLAALLAILVLGPLMGLVLELMARRIATSGLALQVAATVGVLLVVEAGTQLIFGTTETRTVPVFISKSSFTIDGTIVQWADAITLIFAVAVTVALAMFFRFSRSGAQMRAVVDNPELLSLLGTSPVRTRRLAWMIGTVLVSASGVLFAPLLPLDPIQLTLLIVAAFGAAAIGAFSSLPMTLAGGLGIGVLASLSTKWFTTGLLAGAPPSLPFIVLFVVLLVFPKRKLAGKVFTAARTRATWTVPGRVQLLAALVLLVVLAFVPSFAGIHLTAWTIAVATAIVFLSLSLLVRTSGQVSLAQVSFTAIGAAGFSHLAVDHHVPWLIALLLAGLIAVPIGAVLAVPAIRLTGIYLALATFGFGILLQGMFYTQSYMFGSNGVGLSEPRPTWLGTTSDRGFYYLVLVLAALSAALVIGLNRSRLGRLMRGMADSPMAVATSGADVNVTRLLVFCLSAFLAAVGGALAAVAQTTVSGDSYQPLTSLTYFVLIVIVFGGEPWNAVIASAALILAPAYVTSSNTTTYLQLAFGVLAVGVAVLPASAREVPRPIRKALDGMFRRPDKTVPTPPPSTSLRTPVSTGALEVRALQVRFGGVRAVDDVSLIAPTGAITGLIGPNGAGKTTTFNACSGLVRPTAGEILFDGKNVTGRSPARRARGGLGRTFQKIELFESLTVRENVAIGVEASLAGANPFTHVAGRPGNRKLTQESTQHALELCDLTELAGRPVNALSTGQRRLVELARCLAGDFRVLLLDEPSSGLDRAETERFGEILKTVVAERGVGILLVEHDMSLVLDVCQDVYVLDFGRLVFHGPPAELTDSPIVRAAYLGDAAVESAVADSVSMGASKAVVA